MSAPHPLIIVGLDGATLRVLEPLAKTGRIPTLARLMREGLTGTLRSTVPVATLPAWTSFMTASHPATHGVTDIFMRTPGSYGLQPSSGAHRQLPTILNHLSSRGYRVASLGIPGTYPPERLNHACGLANQQGLYRLQQVKDILASNQDKLYQAEEATGYQLPQHHANIRGPHHFH